MKYEYYYVENSEGKSNCVIRTFTKIFNMSYDEVLNELLKIKDELNTESFNDICVFEEFMNIRNMNEIGYGKDILIKNLELENGTYAVFCYDKKDFYHMIPIINNIIYDKKDDCLDLHTIKVYKLKK